MFVKKNKSHGRTYLNFVEGYSDHGKVKHRVVEKIGYLDELEKVYDDPVAHFSEIAKKRTEEKKREPIVLDPDRTLGLGTDDLKYLGYFPFKKLYGQIGLPAFFRNLQRGLKLTYNLNSVALFLILSRIIDPGSVRACYARKDRFFEKFDFTDKQVYRAYDYLYKYKGKILDKLYSGVSKFYDYQTGRCRYDVTNYFFEIRYNDEDTFDKNGVLVKEGLRKKGKSKEHRKTPIVQMGLLLDENGIPMSYEIFPGNRSEKLHLRPTLREVKNRFNPGRIVVVADRGINTGNNCGYLSNGTGDGYIYGNSIRQEDQAFKNWVLDQSDYICEETGEVDPKTGRPVIFKHKSKTEWASKKLRDENGNVIGKTVVEEKTLVYYSAKYAEKERKEREKEIRKAQSYIDHPSYYTQATNIGAAGLIKEVEEEEKEQQEQQKEEEPQEQPQEEARSGEEATPEDEKDKKKEKPKKKKLVLDLEKIEEQQKYDGYFSIITSEVEMSDLELRDAYKQLWEIEEAFKMSKEELSSRPVFMSRQEHIEVHFLICYIGLLFTKLIEYQCEDKFSYHQLIQSLRSYNCGYLEQNYYANLFYDEVIDYLAKKYDLKLDQKYPSKKDIRDIVKY